MARAALAAGLAAALASACSSPPATTPPPAAPDPCKEPAAGEDPRCLPAVPPYAGAHAIDAVTHPLFFRAGHVPEPAGASELCRRLGGDLLGRFPTADETAAWCPETQPIDAGAIARAMQARPEYLEASERFWRDRFRANDVTTDWRYLKQLFAIVDRLHRSELRYGDFAVAVLAHPGFVMTELQPSDRVRLAFTAFLGRAATDAEAADLASLYRPWAPASEPDPDFPYTYRFRSTVFPVLCEPLLHCTAHLLGGGRVVFPGPLVTTAIPYEELSAAQKDALSEIGRVIVRQPFFHEAAADMILNRLLGWSDGGRFPREPGILLPAVRQAVAEHLARTGDWPATERLVITSWLYRQKARITPEARAAEAAGVPPWRSGPVKPSDPETWFDTAARVTYDLGTCDPRYGDHFTQARIAMAAQQGMLPMGTTLAAELGRLHTLEENRAPFRRYDPMTMQEETIDLRYLQSARLLGGCPGFAAKRQGPTGIAFAFTQDAFAELLCRAGTFTGLVRPAGMPTLEATVRHLTRALYGRDPEPEELAVVAAEAARCTGAECSADALAQSTCVALLGSAEMLFY